MPVPLCMVTGTPTLLVQNDHLNYFSLLILIHAQLFGVWTLAGIAYGMVELIRRVLCVPSPPTCVIYDAYAYLQYRLRPADIVGAHVGKLRRLDATVVSDVCPH